MARYAPNESGINALRSMSAAIHDAIEQIQTRTADIQSAADEYSDTLGPHKESLDGALDYIRESVKQASDPANSVAEVLNEVAEAYQEIIENDRIEAAFATKTKGFAATRGVIAATTACVSAVTINNGPASDKNGSNGTISSNNDANVNGSNSIVESLNKSNVEYRQVQLAPQGRTTQDIINRISGGDLTKGSCSSLALAYAGNKAGYDVLDFRDGDSRSFFSSRDSIQKIADLPGVQSVVLHGTNDIETSNQLLSYLQNGKEYYFATGGHAAIVRKNGERVEYLELQHPANGNGWHAMDANTLEKRFGCFKSREVACASFLIDIDSLGKNQDFIRILGFINTESSQQKKGGWGLVK